MFKKNNDEMNDIKSVINSIEDEDSDVFEQEFNRINLDDFNDTILEFLSNLQEGMRNKNIKDIILNKINTAKEVKEEKTATQNAFQFDEKNSKNTTDDLKLDKLKLNILSITLLL